MTLEWSTVWNDMLLFVQLFEYIFLGGYPVGKKKMIVNMKKLNICI